MGVVIKLPSGKDKRKAVFEKMKALAAKNKAGTPPEDKGGSYLLIRFLFFAEPEL
jgi:hypothetical protein